MYLPGRAVVLLEAMPSPGESREGRNRTWLLAAAAGE